MKIVKTIIDFAIKFIFIYGPLAFAYYHIGWGIGFNLNLWKY